MPCRRAEPCTGAIAGTGRRVEALRPRRPTAKHMADRRDILIVGGSGVVGRRIAALLVSEFPRRVVVAGRDGAKAAALCAQLGHGARGRRIDVSDFASVTQALDGVGTVIGCVARRRRRTTGTTSRIRCASSPHSRLLRSTRASPRPGPSTPGASLWSRRRTSWRRRVTRSPSCAPSYHRAAGRTWFPAWIDCCAIVRRDLLGKPR